MSGHSLFRHALPYTDDSLEVALRDEALSLPEFPSIPFAIADEDLRQVEAELRAAREKSAKPKIDHVIVPEGEQGRLLYDMMRASPAFFAHEVLTGPLESPYNGRFLVSEHHEAWDDLLTRYKRICIEAARDHGKCQPGDTLIQAADGRRVRLAEWGGGDVIAYNPATHGLEKRFAPAARVNGMKRVLRFTTKSGRRTVVTENHPLRLWDGWVSADTIEVGERIGVPYRLANLGTGHTRDAWLLGLLVGDGGLTGSNVILSTADELVLSAIRNLGIHVAHGSQYDYRLGGLQNRMREVGLWKKSSHTKRVPDIIFQSRDADIAEFISGYLDADAHINLRAGGAIEFYSVSELLLRDVQHLLVRLGVLASLTAKRGLYKGQRHNSWRLTIRGKDICTLGGVVHPRGVRAAQILEIMRIQNTRGLCSGAAIDRFPSEVWGKVDHNPHWFMARGYPRPGAKYAPTRDKVRAVASAEGNAELLALADAPILWDEVVLIEDLGEQHTWGLQVSGLANYIADDVVSHNTFFFDFAFPLWKLATCPGSIGFIFSGTQPQAIRILGDIKDEIESNPRLTWLQPQIKRGVQWSSTCIQCSNGSRIYARGFGTKVRGAHPDWIVVDDGLNDETIYSETVRLKQIDYFYSAISNMLIPGGQLIVVGTPFTVQDLYASLAKNTEYVFRKFPALDDAGNPLWPDRYSTEALAAKRREVQSVRFTREFMCEPISDDMSLFPQYLFEGEQVEQPTVKLGAPLEFWKEIGIVSVAMGVDFALSTSAKADYTVIWVMGRDGKGNRWIMDIVRGHGAAYQSQLSKITEVARLYEPGIIFVESNQAQQIFGDELIRNTDLPIHKFVTGVQKHALDKGVPSLRVLLENGKIKIPRGDKRSVEMTNIWRDEMRAFTWANGKLQSVINHDDCVMACWICEQAIRHGGFAFDFGTDMDYDSPEEKVASMAEVMKELTGDANYGGADTAPKATGNLVDDIEAELDVAFDGDLPVMRGAEKPNEAALRGTWE
jgi:intein/homing endonuclease/phage terminase large subunit-like protein